MRAGVSFSTGAQIMHTADCKPFSGELLGFSGNLKRHCFHTKTVAFFVHDTRARNGVSILYAAVCSALRAAYLRAGRQISRALMISTAVAARLTG